MTTKHTPGLWQIEDREELRGLAAELLAALRDCKAAIHHFLKADDQATQDHILDLASACATARAAIEKAESV